MNKSNDAAGAADDLPTPVASDAILDRAAAVEAELDEWLNDYAEDFDPIGWASAGNERYFRRKAFNEIAFHLYVSNAYGSLEDIADLHELVLDRTNDPSYYRLVQRCPSQLLLYGYPGAYLRQRGELSEAATNAYDSVLEENAVWSKERPQFRLLDLWHFCKMYGHPPNPFDLETLLERSCVNLTPDVVDATVDDAYAFTHDLLFYHNFGVKGESFPDGTTPYDLRTTITGLTLKFMAQEDYDVVGELLICGILERAMDPSFLRFVFDWVDTAVEEHGYAPGPDGVAGPKDLINDVDADLSELPDKEWFQHYHTTSVVGVACKLLRHFWPQLEDREETGEPIMEANSQEVLRLATVLNLLSEYNLEGAASQIADMAEVGIAPDVVPAVFDEAVSFLERQRTTDGSYGYWTDERRLYLSMGNDTESFEEELVEPVTETCERAIRLAEATDRPT